MEEKYEEDPSLYVFPVVENHTLLFTGCSIKQWNKNIILKISSERKEFSVNNKFVL